MMNAEVDDITVLLTDGYTGEISQSKDSLSVTIHHPDSNGTVGKPYFHIGITRNGTNIKIEVVPDGSHRIFDGEFPIPQGAPLNNDDWDAIEAMLTVQAMIHSD